MNRNKELVPGRRIRIREILDRKKERKKRRKEGKKNLQCLHGIKLLKVIILSISFKK